MWKPMRFPASQSAPPSLARLQNVGTYSGSPSNLPGDWIRPPTTTYRSSISCLPCLPFSLRSEKPGTLVVPGCGLLVPTMRVAAVGSAGGGHALAVVGDGPDVVRLQLLLGVEPALQLLAELAERLGLCLDAALVLGQPVVLHRIPQCSESLI